MRLDQNLAPKIGYLWCCLSCVMFQQLMIQQVGWLSDDEYYLFQVQEE
jgi:hypothetical protein